MSLRDYFAAKAMQAIIMKNLPDLVDRGDFITQKQVSGGAYSYADAMLAERAK